MNRFKYSANIRKARKEFGKTQGEMAELMHICESTYCKFEQGKRNLISPHLTAMSKVIGLSEVEILAGGRISNGEHGILSTSDNSDEKIKKLKAIHKEELDRKQADIDILLGIIRDLKEKQKID